MPAGARQSRIGVFEAWRRSRHRAAITRSAVDEGNDEAPVLSRAWFADATAALSSRWLSDARTGYNANTAAAINATMPGTMSDASAMIEITTRALR
jgi:hypothetical protein